MIGQALGAIENALLDAKAKTLGLPCYALLGGKMRDRIRLYWSHCATWRINHPEFYKPPLRASTAFARSAASPGNRLHGAEDERVRVREGTARGWRPGFGTPFEPGRNVERSTLRHLRAHLEALREGAGPDIDILST